MVKFVAIKINYDARDLAAESKYAVVPNAEELQRFIERYEDEGIGGYGFHECLNFQIREDTPVQSYLPPTGIPKSMDEEYIIFSFTYKNETFFPSTVLGVHGKATLISKDGVLRPEERHIGDVDKLTYHIEADPDFVTLFSSPLSYERENGRYTKPFRNWGYGLRYIEASHAANILKDALARGLQDLKTGSNSYRAFVQRGIEVINRIIKVYGLNEVSSRNSNKLSSIAKKVGGGGLPDKILGQKGEELVFRREQEFAVKQGLKREVVSWASQSNPTLPYDIETIRLTPEGHRKHFIEVKSTTLDSLTNIYVSQQQIEYMKANRDTSSFVVLLFDWDGKLRREWTFSVNQLLHCFELQPIKFRLNPSPSFSER